MVRPVGSIRARLIQIEFRRPGPWQDRQMSDIIEIHLPIFPECWQSCGHCGSNGITIDDITVVVGDIVRRDDTILILETGKVALDIPSPANGEVLAILVEVGDQVREREIVMLLALAN